MSTFNAATLYFCDTDAEFRTLIGHFRSSLGTAWAQDSDTGQINPATVTYPASNNSTAGFEIWHMNDSLHSTTPIYLKVEYGRGAAAGSFRAIFSFSLTGTNGAGTLINGTGQSTITISGAPNARIVSDATNYNIYASGGSGRWGHVWWPDVQASPFGRFQMLERFKNSDGTPNGNGFYYHVAAFHGEGATTSTMSLAWLKGATYTPTFQPNSNGNGYTNFLTTLGRTFGVTLRSESDAFSTLRSGKVYGFPFYPQVPGEKYPLTQALLCSHYDFPTDFSNVTLTMYGSSMTFKPMGPFANDVNQLSTATSPIGMLLRYE